jgi:hypothetical protein
MLGSEIMVDGTSGCPQQDDENSGDKHLGQADKLCSVVRDCKRILAWKVPRRGQGVKLRRM